MDYLEAGGHLIDGSRRDLLGKRIVLIAPATSPLDSLEINAELDLLDLLGADGRLAMGDPSHVPAGLYEKQTLESLGLWETVAARLAPMADVRLPARWVPARGGSSSPSSCCSRKKIVLQYLDSDGQWNLLMTWQ